MFPSLSDFLPALSEIYIIISTLLMLILGISKLEGSYNALKVIAPLVIIASLIILLFLPNTNAHTFNGVFVSDYFSYATKFFILMMAFFWMLIIPRGHFFATHKVFETTILLMCLVFSMMMMVSTLDFIVAFISLEISSLVLYIMLAMNRENSNSVRSAMMYFIFGSIATACFLFGISFLYGATGSTHFDNIATDIHTAVAQHKNITLPVLGVFFIVLAFGFKLALAPLHFWLADIFKGASFSTILILATLPKFAEMMLFIRILIQALPDLKHYWQPLLLVYSSGSFIFGTFGALSQTSIKRFFAYSATANMGFVLLGVIQGSEIGLASSGFYMFLYTVTMFAIFAIFVIFEKKGYEIETFEHLNQIAPNYKGISFLLGLLIISLAGLPFAPGFFAKVYVLYAAIFQESYSLTLIAILSSIISVAYYLVFIKTISFNGVASTVKQSVSINARFFKVSILTIIACMISLVFCLNFWIHVTHKTAISLMY
ncbi:MAG: NADH-quinone oxidoreductase subunit N [Proteobacteria bacterium]|nr:NADH-quinone oxidoreductase subunit N [Pseudomonadota bacterium]